MKARNKGHTILKRLISVTALTVMLSNNILPALGLYKREAYSDTINVDLQTLPINTYFNYGGNSSGGRYSKPFGYTNNGHLIRYRGAGFSQYYSVITNPNLGTEAVILTNPYTGTSSSINQPVKYLNFTLNTSNPTNYNYYRHSGNRITEDGSSWWVYSNHLVRNGSIIATLTETPTAYVAPDGNTYGLTSNTNRIYYNASYISNPHPNPIRFAFTDNLNQFNIVDTNFNMHTYNNSLTLLRTQNINTSGVLTGVLNSGPGWDEFHIVRDFGGELYFHRRSGSGSDRLFKLTYNTGSTGAYSTHVITHGYPTGTNFRDMHVLINANRDIFISAGGSSSFIAPAYNAMWRAPDYNSKVIFTGAPIEMTQGAEYPQLYRLHVYTYIDEKHPNHIIMENANQIGSYQANRIITWSSSALDFTPPNPGTLQVTSKTHNSITLNVTGDSDASGVNPNRFVYRIYNSSGGLVQTTAAGARNRTITGLLPNTQYRIEYDLEDNRNNKATSTRTTAWTHGAPMQDTTVLGTTGLGVQLRGDPPSNHNGTRYRYELRPASGSNISSAILQATALNPVNITGLQIEVPYIVWVQSINTNNEPSNYVNTGRTVIVVDNDPPETVGVVNITNLTYDSYTMAVLGAHDSGIGIDHTNAYTFIRETIGGGGTLTSANRNNTITYTGLLPNQRYLNNYSVVDRKGNRAHGEPREVMTMGIPANFARVIEVEGTKARFELLIPSNHNGTRYILRLTNPHVSEIRSNPQLPSQVHDVAMTGVLPELEYSLSVAPVNDANVIGEFKPMTTPEGVPIIVKGGLIIQVLTSQSNLGTISGEVKRSLRAKIQAPMTTPADLFLVDNIGNKTLIKENILGNSPAIDLELELIQGTGSPVVNTDNTTLNITMPLNLTDNTYSNYRLEVRSGVANKDFTSNPFGFTIDTTAPTTHGFSLNYINSTQAQLILSESNTSDNFTPRNQILIESGNRTYNLSENKTIRREGDEAVFYLVDNVGNKRRYTVPWTHNPPPPTGTGGTQDNIDKLENESRDMTAVITLPSEGTHYQVSLDGANWSPWMEKPNSPETVVTLPSGDGKKSVYVRTGNYRERVVPLYIGQDDPMMVPLNEFEVEPLQTPIRNEVETDMTAPSLKVETEDGLNIASGGRLRLLVTVYDNMDPNPEITFELYGRDINGVLSETPSRTEGPFNMSNATSVNGTQIRVTLSDLDTLLPEGGRNYPIVLKVKARDRSNNVRVETMSFFIR